MSPFQRSPENYGYKKGQSQLHRGKWNNLHENFKKNIQEKIDPWADFEEQGQVNLQHEQLQLADGGDALQECHIISTGRIDWRGFIKNKLINLYQSFLFACKNMIHTYKLQDYQASPQCDTLPIINYMARYKTTNTICRQES